MSQSTHYLQTEPAPMEDYALFIDRKKSVKMLTKQLLALLPFFAFASAFYYAMSVGISFPILNKGGATTHITIGPFPFFHWIAVMFLVEYVFIAFSTTRRLLSQKKPLLTLTTEGIVLEAAAVNVGLVQWSEIKDVRTFTLFGRYVGITPFDIGALCRRVGSKRSWPLRITSFFCRPYRLLGIFVPPICVSTMNTSISPEELVTLIESYHVAHHRALNVAPEGSWPPAPK